MEKQKYEFTVVESLALENSFGTLKQEDKVELECCVGINSEDYGWFEFYDVETGGDNWHAEGSLTIDNKTITDYDGVFELPDFIVGKLEELGYNCEDVKS